MILQLILQGPCSSRYRITITPYTNYEQESLINGFWFKRYAKIME